jgi:hypothetical protein
MPLSRLHLKRITSVVATQPSATERHFTRNRTSTCLANPQSATNPFFRFSGQAGKGARQVETHRPTPGCTFSQRFRIKTLGNVKDTCALSPMDVCKIFRGTSQLLGSANPSPLPGIGVARISVSFCARCFCCRRRLLVGLPAVVEVASEAGGDDDDDIFRPIDRVLGCSVGCRSTGIARLTSDRPSCGRASWENVA